MGWTCTVPSRALRTRVLSAGGSRPAAGSHPPILASTWPVPSSAPAERPPTADPFPRSHPIPPPHDPGRFCSPNPIPGPILTFSPEGPRDAYPRPPFSPSEGGGGSRAHTRYDNAQIGYGQRRAADLPRRGHGDSRVRGRRRAGRTAACDAAGSLRSDSEGHFGWRRNRRDETCVSTACPKQSMESIESRGTCLPTPAYVDSTFRPRLAPRRRARRHAQATAPTGTHAEAAE
jgi:hypothetical protein